METKLAHVNPRKIQEVELIKKLIKEYPVVGILNLENIPASHFIKIKYKLRDKILIRTTKKRLMKIAFDQLEKEKKDIVNIKPMLKGIPAFIFSKEDEFKLQKILNKNKTSALAKAGQLANKDIWIKAGPTQFAPGPMIGEFGILGIKTQVLEGKIHVKEDKLIIKEGEVVTDKIAGMLSKLGIEPMEIGLNLVLTYKNGEILTKDALNINEEEYLNNLKKAYSEALNLAIGASYIEKDTIDLLIRKAYVNALALETKTGILPTTETKESIVESQEEAKEKPKEEKVEIKSDIPAKEQKKEVSLKEEIKHKESIETKNVNFNNDEQKKAADILKQLVDKKIRGEI